PRGSGPRAPVAAAYRRPRSPSLSFCGSCSLATPFDLAAFVWDLDFSCSQGVDPVTARRALLRPASTWDVLRGRDRGRHDHDAVWLRGASVFEAAMVVSMAGSSPGRVP